MEHKQKKKKKFLWRILTQQLHVPKNSQSHFFAGVAYISGKLNKILPAAISL